MPVFRTCVLPWTSTSAGAVAYSFPVSCYVTIYALSRRATASWRIDPVPPTTVAAPFLPKQP